MKLSNVFIIGISVITCVLMAASPFIGRCQEPSAVDRAIAMYSEFENVKGLQVIDNVPLYRGVDGGWRYAVDDQPAIVVEWKHGGKTMRRFVCLADGRQVVMNIGDNGFEWKVIDGDLYRRIVELHVYDQSRIARIRKKIAEDCGESPETPAPEYVGEADLPERLNTAELGVKHPRIIIDGQKLVYDAEDRWYHFDAPKGPRAMWIGLGGDMVLGTSDRIITVGVKGGGTKRIVQEWIPHPVNAWRDTDRKPWKVPEKE